MGLCSHDFILSVIGKDSVISAKESHECTISIERNQTDIASCLDDSLINTRLNIDKMDQGFIISNSSYEVAFSA